VKKLVCVSSFSSGVKHRFALLNQVKNFGDLHGYNVHFLWGVSRGVAYCRWEEFFGTISGLQVTNIPEAEVAHIAKLSETQDWIDRKRESFDFVQEGEPLTNRLFAYNLKASSYLERLTPLECRPKMRLLAPPAQHIRLAVAAIAAQHGLGDRVGIRVRVTECRHDKRRPHRNQSELEECLDPLLQVDPGLPVFIVTDSEYIQQRLAAHFGNATWLPKEFDLIENGTRYVHRSDKPAMFTFLKEAFCLCECRRVINIGGFLNDQAARIWPPPYSEAAAALTALAV